MQLHNATLSKLSVMVCGDKDSQFGIPFPYRSSSRLTSFFSDCDLDEYRHDGSTRKYWVEGTLKELNERPASVADLPADEMVGIITQLMDCDYFEDERSDRDTALVELNKALERDSLVAFFDDSGKCHIRHNGTGVTSGSTQLRPRPLSADEKVQRDRLEAYLDRASEDDFTNVVLVPLLQRLGYHRVDVSGHREKILEYGRDLWMKYQLPTGHWLYFGVQVKKVKIDSKGTSGGNATEILNQVRMAMAHAIFDPDLNRKVLPDHVYVVSASEITRGAKHFIAEQLDRDQRRQIIFMERAEFLDFAARIVADLPVPDVKDGDDIPF